MSRLPREESEPLINNQERYRDRDSSFSSSSSDSFELQEGPHRTVVTDESPQSDSSPAMDATTTTPSKKKTQQVVTSATAVDGSSSSTAEDHPDAPLGDSTVRYRREGGVSSNMDVADDHNDAENTDYDNSPTPRFYQDDNEWRRLKWVPFPVRRLVTVVARWSEGPPNPQPYKIKPFFPAVQEYPLFLVRRFLPRFKWRFWLLFFYFSLWLITFVLVKRAGSTSVEIPGWGEPQDISCGDTYWGKGNACGYQGTDCRPFSDSGFAFRCTGGCRDYHVLNPRAVGDQEINYAPFVIGGQKEDGNVTYRGDSFICQAAIHSGIVSDASGGCGVVFLTGQKSDYKASESNGIASVGFDSYFPLSFTFTSGIECSSNDRRWDLLAVSAVFTGVLSLFASHPALFFFPNFIGIFWTVGMALDSPGAKTAASLFSVILGRFLPAMFVAWVMYDKMGVRRTLSGLTAQIERAILWLGPCWVGAMDNYTLSFIPISRLEGHDLKQQPGAIAALTIIIVVLVVVVVTQIFFFRQEGRLLKYLKLYGLFVGAIVISLTLPGLSLRIHHYILALLLLPGTSMQTRPSLIYQGLLVGLFINGIARWNFDSVLQTPFDLQGDAQLGTGLPAILSPVISLANSTDLASKITFNWKPPTSSEWDGLSVLVNDVERFRTYFHDETTPPVSADEFVWTRNKTLDMPEYFRFGWMSGTVPGDYTQAGKWTADGKWVEMKPGPSKREAEMEGRETLVRNRPGLLDQR